MTARPTHSSQTGTRRAKPGTGAVLRSIIAAFAGMAAMLAFTVHELPAATEREAELALRQPSAGDKHVLVIELPTPAAARWVVTLAAP